MRTRNPDYMDQNNRFWLRVEKIGGLIPAAGWVACFGNPDSAEYSLYFKTVVAWAVVETAQWTARVGEPDEKGREVEGTRETDIAAMVLPTASHATLEPAFLDDNFLGLATSEEEGLQLYERDAKEKLRK
jgi:hypothetical protein